ncbi:MAG: hypothetical protein GC200_02445 [Tepidisphaera sp.]|nr:hypothetical protein [Tepidisphaera sp.]
MKKKRTSRRGSVYVLVLAAGVVLTSMGIAGLALVRAQRAASDQTEAAQRARLAAQSALGLGVRAITLDPTGLSWRSGATTGKLFTGMAIGDASCSAFVTDSAGGNLSDSTAGRVIVSGTANVGGARQAVSAEFVPAGTAYPVMQRALWAGGAMTLKGTVYADSPIGSNVSVVGSGAIVKPQVLAPTTSGSTFSGGTGTTTVQTMPTSSVIDQWAAKATPISFSSLPAGKIENVVLSGGYNPYSTSVNSAGVYVIDCGGSAITIRNCRISATLILLNTGSFSIIRDNVLMEPYYRNYPVLMVKGPMTISLASGDLSEASLSVNYNPSGAPYRGVTDVDKTDSYPSEIYGVTYISGDATIDTNSTFEGVVLVGGTLTTSGTVTIRTHSPETAIDGFCSITGFKMRGSTWARSVN